MNQWWMRWWRHQTSWLPWASPDFVFVTPPTSPSAWSPGGLGYPAEKKIARIWIGKGKPDNPFNLTASKFAPENGGSWKTKSPFLLGQVRSNFSGANWHVFREWIDLPTVNSPGSWQPGNPKIDPATNCLRKLDHFLGRQKVSGAL